MLEGRSDGTPTHPNSAGHTSTGPQTRAHFRPGGYNNIDGPLALTPPQNATKCVTPEVPISRPTPPLIPPSHNHLWGHFGRTVQRGVRSAHAGGGFLWLQYPGACPRAADGPCWAVQCFRCSPFIGSRFVSVLTGLAGIRESVLQASYISSHPDDGLGLAHGLASIPLCEMLRVGAPALLVSGPYTRSPRPNRNRLAPACTGVGVGGVSLLYFFGGGRGAVKG